MHQRGEAHVALHLLCPSCGAENRVPQERLGDRPKCGKCASALFPKDPFELSGAALERHLAKDAVPLLVDCWAEWCGPCKTMAPQFAAATPQLAPSVRLAKLDTDANAAVASRLGIRSIPTLILFANGRELARMSGVMDARRIVQWAHDHLQRA